MSSNDLSRYSRGQLESTLTPDQYMQYLSLNSQFRSLFGSQNFGDFDYYSYMTDSNYSGGIQNQTNPDNVQGASGGFFGYGASQGVDTNARQQILMQLESFFQGIESGRFEPVDVRGIYEGAGGELGTITDEMLARRRSELSRETQEAGRMLTRELARLGMSRSGGAQMAVTGLERERMRMMDDAASEAAEWEARKAAALDQHIRDLEVKAATDASKTYEDYQRGWEDWQRQMLASAYNQDGTGGFDWGAMLAGLGDLAAGIGSLMAGLGGGGDDAASSMPMIA